MDKFKAIQLGSVLIGKRIGDFTIQALLNNGKSAAVFRAVNELGQLAAVKIFDNELVERFGHEIQTRRIEQEIALRGHTIPNLVRIIDGGRAKVEEAEVYFIAMEFIDGQNLKDFIETQTYDNSLIQKIGASLFSVTSQLLEKGVVHRDIKPENIMVNSSGDIILMDLGVLKLIGANSFSDQEEKQFVGTLRYAPPEFLTRHEEDSPSGWKAVNLYQIGAIFHDLIMKKELFADVTPYSNLVIAIKEDAPKITSDNIPYSTLQITRDLLIKNWQKRLEICSDERIRDFLYHQEEEGLSIKTHLDEIFNLTSDHKSKFDEIEKLNRTAKEKFDKRKAIAAQIDKSIHNCLSRLGSSGLFKNLRKSDEFHFGMDKSQSKVVEIRNFIYSIEGELSLGFPKPLLLLTRISNDENALAKIELLGIFPSINGLDVANPLAIFRTIRQETENSRARHSVSQVYFNFKTFEAFNGTIGFDSKFEEALTIQIIKLIKTALKSVHQEVQEELLKKEKYARGESQPSLTIIQPRLSKLFYSVET